MLNDGELFAKRETEITAERICKLIYRQTCSSQFYEKKAVERWSMDFKLTRTVIESIFLKLYWK